ALQQETRRAIGRRREHQSRGQLFRSREVLFEVIGKPRQLERHYALVAIGSFALLDRDGELAGAKEPALRRRLELRFVVTRNAADRVAVRALREHETHRTRTLELQRETPLEL